MLAIVGVGDGLGTAVGTMIGSGGGKAVFVGAGVAVGGTSVGLGVILSAGGCVCVAVRGTLVGVASGVLVTSATVTFGIAGGANVGAGEGAEAGSGARVGVAVWIEAPTEGGAD